MHFVINREVILYPLIRVNTVISNNPAMPILSHVLVRFEQGGLTMTGTNIEIQISETIENIDVEDPQDFAFPGPTALEFCRKLSHGCTLSFTKDPESDSLVIETTDLADAGDGGDESSASAKDRASHSRLELQTIHITTIHEDNLGVVYPELDKSNISWNFNLIIDRHSLQTLIRRTRHSMSIKETVRPFLEAMLIEISESEIRTVATDGHRMAMNFVKIDSGLEGPSQRAIVPRVAIEMLSKLLSELTSAVEISFSNNHLQVRTSNVVFISKLMEGKYPDWRAVIPVDLNRTIQGSREELLNVLTRVNILSIWDKTPIAASMEVEEDLLKIHAQSIQAAGQKIDEEIDIEQDGKDIDAPLSFQVRCKYLLDIFDAMPDSDQFQFNLINTRDACVVRFPDDTSAAFLVMLMKKR